MLDRFKWNFVHAFKKSKEIVPLDECVKQFNSDNWNNLDTTQRMKLLEKTMNSYCDSQGIKNKPKLIWDDKPNEKGYFGRYNSDKNIIYINMGNEKFENPYKALDTITHES